LSTTTVCQKRRFRRPKPVVEPDNFEKTENSEKTEYTDDHMADFEKQRKIREKEQKERADERQKIEDRKKLEASFIEGKAARWAKFFVWFIMAIMAHGVYKSIWLAYSRYTQEGLSHNFES